MKRGIKSVEIILDPGSTGWVLGKISQRINDELNLINCKTVVRHDPKFNTDVTFWIHYTDKTLRENLNSQSTNIRCALVTHVDESQKLLRIKNLCKFGIVPIFMSEEHAEAVARKLKHKMGFRCVRIGSDIAQNKKYFHIGIVSKCHPDGRKNENWLIEFAKLGLLENVEITFIGEGWKNTVKKLRSKSIKVNNFDGIENEYPSYVEIIEIQKSFDLFFYFGFDEGSLGALDSYLLGKDLFISKQGFHINFDIKDSSFFENLSDAKEKFQIKKELYFKSLPNLNLWTWESTANQLVDHWIEIQSSKMNSSSNPDSDMSFINFLKNYLDLFPKSIYRLIFVRLPVRIAKYFSK